MTTHGDARRRRLGAQRPQGVDDDGPHRHVGDLRRADESGRAQASGLTYFLVDMQAPGVDVRPLRQISGEAEFNEVIFDGARVPDSMRVGDARRRLARHDRHPDERAGPQRRLGQAAAGSRGHRLRDAAVEGAWPLGSGRERPTNPTLDRGRSDTAHRAPLGFPPNESGDPGPEGSILKLAVGLLPQRVYGLCLELMGPAGQLISDYDFVQPTRTGEDRMGDGSEDIDIVKAFVNVCSTTIGGGTTEMQKNAIGERILGLPGEPRNDRDIPWNQVPR